MSAAWPWFNQRCKASVRICSRLLPGRFAIPTGAKPSSRARAFRAALRFLEELGSTSAIDLKVERFFGIFT
jgi:hypothetical protein